MPTRTDDAIVLTRYPFRERDLIVALLTRESGQLRVLARRARGARKVEATALEPLNRVRVTYFERRNAELATLMEATALRTSFALAERPEAWAAGQVVAELALVYVQPGQRQSAAFRLVDACLVALASGSSPLAATHYAELWFLRLSGVFPLVGACAVCEQPLQHTGVWFDLGEGVYLCREHRTTAAHHLSIAALAWVSEALRSPVEEVRTPAPGDAAEWLAAMRRRFTERDLASLRFLQRLLGAG